MREKRIEGISDICATRSDRDGMRIVIELKRDAVADVVLNQLYRFTPLQTTFGANMLALNGGRPEQMGLKRHARAPSSTSARRWSAGAPSSCSARRATARHVLVGLAIAVANIDEVIRLIRSSRRARPRRASG